MKKTLTTAALSSVLVLGMASAAMAVHGTEPAETAVVAPGMTKVTLDGNVRMRGKIQKSNPAQDSSAATQYDGRVQLGVKAQVSPQTTAYVQLESGTDSGDTYPWGQQTATSLFTGGTKDTEALTILQAWINYQPSNWGVKVGHMPLALGNKVFFDHTGSGDDAIVAYMNPNDSMHIAALAIKFQENSGTDNSDDLDGYVALATYKVSDSLNVGVNWTYLVGGDSAGTTTVTPNPTPPPPVIITTTYEPFNGLAMSNVGVTVDGKMGPISYSADGEFQFGDYSDNGVTTVDAGGYAVRLAGGMDLGAFKVGLLYGYGSGDSDSTDNDLDTFINFLTDTAYDVIIGNYIANIPGTFTQHSGLSNLSLYQVNASTKMTCPLTGKGLGLKTSVSYMTLNEETTIYGAGPGAVKEDEVGTELDLVATWQLTAGLNYKIEAAYQFVGDVYKTAAAGAGSDPDDLYFLRNTLEVKF